MWKATARYRANTYDNPNLSGARAGWITSGSDIEVLGENAKSYFIRYWADNGATRERYVERTAVKGLNEDKENKKQVNNNVINKNPIVKPVQREDKKQEQTSYGVWKATARYTANTYDNPDLRGARAGWITSGSDIEVLGENAKSYFIRYWADNGATRERYVERTAVKGLNEDKENKQQVNNNVINKNPIVKPVQREDKKQEQSSSYGVWKATARYRANTYDNPNLSGARAGWITSGSDIEVLGENAKSYFIRYWADNGATRERYVERTAVKGLNEDKENKKQVNNNVINKNPIVKPVQREDKKQEQSSSYGVWKATARYRANTYDNPNLSGARAGWITSDSDIEVLGENAKSYFIRYWADNGAKRERYVERTAVKGLNEDKENKKQEQTSYGVWKATARYTANTYDNPDLRGMRAGRVTSGSDLEVLGENAKSYFIRYWADNGATRERYVERTAVKGLNEKNEINDKRTPSGYYYPLGRKSCFIHSDKYNKYKNHDCMQAEGTPIYAACDGTAEFCQIMGTYNGKYTTVSYGNVIYLYGVGVKFIYAHLSKFAGVALKYNSGKASGSTYTNPKVTNRSTFKIATKTVKAGELIGYVGTTGNSSGSHLHLEVYVNGVRKEPNDYFNK